MSKKVDELKERYAAADRRVKELSQQLRDLPAAIEAAAREEAVSKARTVREGGNVATAVASELPKLRERQEALPYEVWAARIARAEAGIALQEEQAKEAHEEAQDLRAKLEAAEAMLKDAQAAHDVVRDRHYLAATRAQNLRLGLRPARQDLANLEAEGPRHLA